MSNSNKLLGIDLTNRIYGLDILRAYAIMHVLLEHGYFYCSEIMGKVRLGSFNGVSTFFVLSGFLIGGILIKTINKGDHSFKALLNFWKKRWFRTVPPYYFILILLLIPALFQKTEWDGKTIYKYFFFIQNFNVGQPNFFVEAWSLAVEEWFYIIVPISIFLCLNLFKVNCKKAVLITVFSIMILIPLFRFSEYCEGTVPRSVLTRLDSLVYGVLGAYLNYYCKNFWNKYRIHLVLVALVIFFIPKIFVVDEKGLYYCVFSVSFISLGILCLLPIFSSIKTGKGIIYKIISHISIISYSMYLLNLSVISYLLYLLRFMHLTAPQALIAYFILTFSLATLMYKYVETPFMKMRAKYVK